MPGVYEVSDTIDLSSKQNICIRGLNLQTCTIQRTINANVEGNNSAVLIKMGQSCRIEDLTLSILTSHTNANSMSLTAIEYGDSGGVGTSLSSKIRTCIINVTNTFASTTSTVNNFGVHFNGTFQLGNNFSFNAIKGSTINVNGNGGGNNIGIYVSAGNQCSIRDTNVLVSAPSNANSNGSYIGVKVNDQTSGEKGSIELRSSTIGTIPNTTGPGTWTSSDILQQTPSNFTNAPYLSSPGIQIGPGVDLVTKTAGGKAFSVYVYPTIIYYGVRGNLRDGIQSGNADTFGFLWPGSANIVGNGVDQYPDPNLSASAFFRIQQSALLCGMFLYANSASGTISSPFQNLSTTIQCFRTPFTNSTYSSRVSLSSFTLNLGASEKFVTNYSASERFNQGDLLSVYVHAHGGNNNQCHDLTLQLDLF